jgi:hypothetical protein
MPDESSKKPQLFPNLWVKEAPVLSVPRPVCRCLSGPPHKLLLHTEAQDTECAAWQRLNELIDTAARDGRETFSPGRELSSVEWTQITTLPPSIAKLKAVKHLILYGSSLVRIPPEIGELESLEEFTPYTSYRLHWFPYEILRCKKLKESTISTRALYGNYKHRPPFPRLPQLQPTVVPQTCSVCNSPLTTESVQQVWISLRVATDVVPLLVHACSDECIAQLPTPPDNYVQTPHQGGLQLQQPAPYH